MHSVTALMYLFQKILEISEAFQKYGIHAYRYSSNVFVPEISRAFRKYG